MRCVSLIVSLLVAIALATSPSLVHAGETDCDRIALEVELEGYIPTWCYFDLVTQAEARAQWEAMFVEGASSYAMVVSAQAFAFTYLPRQTMASLIEELLEDGQRTEWREDIPVDDHEVQRFVTIESSGRETNCVAFNRITAAPNGRPRSRLYGYICTVGRGQLEDDSVIAFIEAVDD